MEETPPPTTTTKKMEGKKNIPVEYGCSVHFRTVEIVTRVFFFVGFFPLDKQLQQAILHLPTLELSIEAAQTKK